MSAAPLNLALEQGVTYTRTLTWRLPISGEEEVGDPVDLTGASAQLSVRTQHGGRLMVTLTSDDDGGLVLGGDAGTIVITFDAAAAMLLDEVAGVYDLLITKSDSTTVRLVEGTVSVELAVTTGE